VSVGAGFRDLGTGLKIEYLYIGYFLNFSSENGREADPDIVGGLHKDGGVCRERFKNFCELSSDGLRSALREIRRLHAGKRIVITTRFDAGHTFERRIIEAFPAWDWSPWSPTTRVSCNASASSSSRPAIVGLSTYPNSSSGIAHIKWRSNGDACTLQKAATSQIDEAVLADRKALADCVDYPARGRAYRFGLYRAKGMTARHGHPIDCSRTTKNTTSGFPLAEPWA
jgi:hypothetical protein